MRDGSENISSRDAKICIYQLLTFRVPALDVRFNSAINGTG
jgi:hypothetical protein